MTKYLVQQRKQCGQGMVGFIVAATFFVVPTALGINYLARIGDAKHKSYEAARYGAWERTVWHQSDARYNRKSDLDISREINQRIFGEQNRPMDSQQDRRRVAPSALTYDPNLYGWGNRDPIIETPARRGAEPNQLAIAESAAPGRVAGVVSNALGRWLRLQRNGFYNSRVDLQLQRDPKLITEFDQALGRGTPLVTSSNNAMLVGAWNANGPADVRRVVARAVPSTLLNNGVTNALRRAATLARFREFRNLEFGRVDPERVPCQRLRSPRRRGLGC